jgi:RHS repeat-associated protein
MDCIYESLFVTKAFLSALRRRVREKRIALTPVHCRWSRAIPQAIACLLVISLLATSTPAAPKILLAVASECKTDLSFWLKSSDWPETWYRALMGQALQRAKPQENQQTRDSRIARIEIQPGKRIVQAGEQFLLSAIAYDSQGVPVGGVSFEWQSDYPALDLGEGILPHGAFSASVPGQYVITAAAGGLSSSVKVDVLPKQSTGNLPLVIKSVSSNSIDQPSTKPPDRVERAHARPIYQSPFIDGDPSGWNSTNKPAAFIPQNERGETPGRSTVSASSSNFRINAPVLSLPGRGGFNLNLSLIYSSRLWSKSNNANNQIIFNADRDQVAPGWSLSLGRIINMVDAGAFLIDADGTRHSFVGQLTINPNNGERYFSANTTDGSFIEYGLVTRGIGTGSVDTFGRARYPDGTTVWFGGALTIQNSSNVYVLYTHKLIDSNGNYIFCNYSSGKLSTIVDTLGRVVTFHYDSNQLLTAITAAGLKDDNGVVVNRTLVRLHYKQLTLDATFQGLTPVVTTSTVWVIDAIYYPATASGQWFGDSDSYSSYGMIKKVKEQKSMIFSNAPLTEQGTFQVGTVTSEIEYDYPTGPSNLTDAPKYDTVTQSWEGSTSGQAVTEYEVAEEGSTRKVTTILPDLNKSIEYSYLKPGQWDNGLVYKTEIVEGSTILQTITTTWEQGHDGAPRVTRRDFTNVRNQTHFQTFGYGAGTGNYVFNQLAEMQEFGYNGNLIRKTKWAYNSFTLDRILYSGLPTDDRPAFMTSLVTSMEVFAADGTKVARTEYNYDNYNEQGWVPGSPYPGNLVNTPGVVSFSPYFDPYWFGMGYQFGGYSRRGNITSIVSYPNALDPASAITTNVIYDKTGNVRTVTTNNKQNTFVYTLGTQYAYSTTDTVGSSDPNSLIKITTSCTYDFNTGLKLSATDANSRPTQEAYYLDSWRHKQTIAPTGANVLDEYNDVALSVTSTSKGSDGTIAEKTVTKLDGRGQTIRTETLAANDLWDLQDTQYDDLGRTLKESLPYRSGQTPTWIETTYDALGRVTKKTAPDQSESRIFYNEATRPSSATATPGDTARSVDAWGRERWVLTDALNRLIEVVEPDPNGTGSVTATGNLQTKYTYDAADNLTQVDHDAQQRRFRYDSFRRLTHQKLAEADATLDNAGVYVGTATGEWSSVFAYDTSSNIVWSVDARGVKTISSYNNDPLNRLQSIEYNTNGVGAGQTIHAAPSVTFAYTPSGDITRLQSLAAANVSTETFDYDSEGRLKETNLVFTSRPQYPALIEFIYDSLSRLTNTRYPAQYGVTGTPRKFVQHDYDVASRPAGLKVDGADYASQIVYNAASQPTSVKVGSGINQTTETFDYDPVTLLLSRQRVQLGTSTLLDLNYGYLRQGTTSGRTGQLTSIVNNLNGNKNRSYTYDTLGRLKQATGGSASAPIWTQDYSYDQYGNRLSVSSTGSSAWNRKHSNDLSGRPEAQVAEALAVPRPQKQQSFSHHASRPFPAAVAKAPAISSPPIFTDDPLNDPQNPQKIVIKAIHITELRDAINALRALLGLDPYSWVESVSAGNYIQKDHISEMRTALDQALGAPAGGYSAGLTLGLPVLAVHIQELRERIKTSWSTITQIPRDGHVSLVYSASSNRITTSGFEYDAAGNQTKVVLPDGLIRFYEYDAANRLAKVRDENHVAIATYTYGDGNQRLIAQAGDNSNERTYYVSAGDVVLTEYTETPSTATTPGWSRNYVYLEGQLLATQDKNGTAEQIEFHHHDRLGTRLVTRPDGTWYEQVTLPFGVPITTESNGVSNRRFTTYDRNTLTGLDYANARSYQWTQGRFTQVDPIGMAAVDLSDPQTLNLYAYCANDPINAVDPSGMGPTFFSFGGFGFGFGSASGVAGEFLGGLFRGFLNFGLGVLGTLLGGQGNSTFLGFPFLGSPQPIRPPNGPSITRKTITYKFPIPATEHTNDPGDPPFGSPQRASSFARGYGQLVWGHRTVVIQACADVHRGIISDITVALISYSKTPTARRLNSTTQPLYGEKVDGDQRAHIIGWAVGGPPIPENLTWMAARVNNGGYKQMENFIRKVLTEHKDWQIYAVINHFYPDPYLCVGGSFRPNGGKAVIYAKIPRVDGRRRLATLRWVNTNKP